MLNSRDVLLLRADVAANCRIWEERCKTAGLPVLITNTVRDKAYQEYLYAQGRTRPGSIVTNGRTPTFHSDKAGLAWDFCKNVKGHEYDDPLFFQAAADIAKELGFSWGGDWKSFPDSPHIQWDDHGRWTSAMILAGRLPPDMPLYGEGEAPSAPSSPQTKEEVERVARYQTVAECPSWAQDTVRKLIDKGYLGGSGKTDDAGLPADLDLSNDMVRLLVINDRAGIYGS